MYETLIHAYGPATDTPGHLAALREEDDAAREAALEHLWSAVVHQGTPWTATPPVALAVAEMLAGPLPGGAALKANLLGFLAAVAKAGSIEDRAVFEAMANPVGRDVDAAIEDESFWEDEDLANAMYARAVLGCAEVVPAIADRAVSMLNDPDAGVRSAAAHAATSCRQAGSGLGERLAALAAMAGPDERAAAVLAMGEVGLAPREWLADAHPGVRACAALAPALAGDPEATAEILAALKDPLACDDWFTERPPQLRFHIRFSLVAAAIERVGDFERLLPAALAVARIAGKYSVDFDWGPLLLLAFPPGRREAETGPLSGAQRQYLMALVENAQLWDPTHGNAGLVFREAGLPYDREACRALAGSPA